MPISIKNLFGFRKVRELHADPIRQQAQTKIKNAQPPKQRYYASKSPKNNKSIFSRIANFFKKQPISTPQFNLPTSKVESDVTHILEQSYKTQAARKTPGFDALNVVDDYANGSFINNIKFLHRGGKQVKQKNSPSKNVDQELREGYSQYLTRFCEGNANQANRLSSALTLETVKTVSQKLRRHLSITDENKKQGHYEPTLHVTRTQNQDVRVHLTQDVMRDTSMTKTSTIIDIPPQADAKPIVQEIKTSEHELT